jgi:hypothetical protein
MFRIAMLLLSAVFLLLTVNMYASTEQAEDSNAAIGAKGGEWIVGAESTPSSR